VSFPSLMLFEFDGARKEAREGCVSVPLAGISCSCDRESRCVDALGNGLFWPCEDLESDLEIVRRLACSEIDAIASSLQR
jgi:hypothetical protein